MTGVRPDVTKLSLNDHASASASPSPTRPHAHSPLDGEAHHAAPAGLHAGTSGHGPTLMPHEPGPHWRVRNSTLGEHYAASKSHRASESSGDHEHNHNNERSPSRQRQQLHQQSQNEHAPPQQHGEQPAHHYQNQQHLKPADSSASVSSMASQRSNKSRSGPPSVVELKRFFGKGRTKHDKPDNTAAARRAEPKKTDKGGLLGSLFFRNKAKKGKAKPPAVFDLHGTDAEADRDRRSGSGTGSPSSTTDPNLVVHAPGYETWDPFHVFGLGEDGENGEFAERLPFLESEITKYGEMGKDMGSGAGGNVRMMERPSDHKLFAVKEFRARKPNETVQKYAKHVTTEYALGAAFHHEHIIETIDLIKEGDRYYEVMEYGPNDFFALVMSGTMTTPQIDSSFHQIVSGVHYLHTMGVAHRDLKLDNCVVTTDGVVKLIDFGSAVVFKYPMSPQIHMARGIMGSDPYLAPEVFERRPYQPQIADIWSCGIIYCCIYLRRFPWKLPQQDDPSFRKFAEAPGNIDGQHPHHNNPRKIVGPWRLLRLLPVASRPLIARILTISVESRATMDEIRADPWFANIREISVMHQSEKPTNAPHVSNQVAAHA